MYETEEEIAEEKKAQKIRENREKQRKECADMKNIWNKNPIFLGETKKSILSKGHRPTLKITLKDSTSFWAFYYGGVKE